MDNRKNKAQDSIDKLVEFTKDVESSKLSNKSNLGNRTKIIKLKKKK